MTMVHRHRLALETLTHALVLCRPPDAIDVWSTRSSSNARSFTCAGISTKRRNDWPRYEDQRQLRHADGSFRCLFVMYHNDDERASEGASVGIEGSRVESLHKH